MLNLVKNILNIDRMYPFSIVSIYVPLVYETMDDAYAASYE